MRAGSILLLLTMAVTIAVPQERADAATIWQTVRKELTGDGVAHRYTKSPFMLTLRVGDNTQIAGWKSVAGVAK